MTPHDDQDLRAIWQASAGPSARPSIAELKKREWKLTLRVKIRNGLEYVAAAGVVATCLASQGSDLPLAVRLTLLATIPVVVFVVWKLRRDGSALKPPPADAALAATIAHHRASLVRQRDLLRSAPYWYVAPFVVIFVLFYGTVAFLQLRAHPWADVAWPLGSRFGGTMAFCAFLVWGNLRAARKLDEKIAALDAESS